MSSRYSAAAVGLLLLLAQPVVRAAELQVWTAPDTARELLRFLRSPKALAVIEAQGMEPAP
jgi:ABC-type molybdate transport system substrate-binding protein